MSDDKKHEGCAHPFHDHDHGKKKGPFDNTKRWGFNPGVEDYNPWTVDVREVIKGTGAYKQVVGEGEHYDEKAAAEIEEILSSFSDTIDNIRRMFDDPESARALKKQLDSME